MGQEIGISIAQALDLVEVLTEAQEALDHELAMERDPEGKQRLADALAQAERAEGKLLDQLSAALPAECECTGCLGCNADDGGPNCSQSTAEWLLIGEDRDGEGDTAALCAQCAAEARK